jgi:hypothetical protein
LASVGCGNLSVGGQLERVKIEPCRLTPLPECGHDVLTEFDSILATTALDAQADIDTIAAANAAAGADLQVETGEQVTIGAEEQDELFKLMKKIDAAGTLLAMFSSSVVNSQGLTETDEGIVSVNFAGSEGACRLAAKSTTGGTPVPPPGSPPDTVLPPVSIATNSTSTICTGTINQETGQFELEGTMQNNVTAQTGHLGTINTSGIGAFHIIGLLNDGQVTGTIFFSNKAIDLVPQS